MYTGAELSHTWIDKERTREEFADVVQIDIYGKPFDQQICFNNPDVRAYGIALYTDLVANYDVDMVQTCVRGLQPGPRRSPGPLGLARGPAADRHRPRRLLLRALPGRRRAARHRLERDGLPAEAGSPSGYDRYNAKQAFELNLLWNSTVTATALLADTPELYQWIKFRMDSLTEFYGEIYRACHAARAEHRRPAEPLRRLSRADGPGPASNCAPYLDSVRSSDYAEQTGDPKRVRSGSAATCTASAGRSASRSTSSRRSRRGRRRRPSW